MKQLDPQIKKNLELIEGDAWINVFKAATPGTIKTLGSGYKVAGCIHLTYVKAADTLALNKVIGYGLDGNNGPEILNLFKKQFKTVGALRFFVQVYPELLTSEFQDTLDKAGFLEYNKWVKFYRDNSDPKEIFTDIAVRKINKDQADSWSSIVINAFEWEAVLTPLLRDFVGSANWHHYIGYYNNTPVAAASSFISGEYCWLGFAATLKGYRSLGAQLALIHKRIVDGISLGCKHFIVETAQNTAEKKSQSFINITNMGFEPVYLRPNFIYTAK
jgi:hypothetical protein